MKVSLCANLLMSNSAIRRWNLIQPPRAGFNNAGLFSEVVSEIR